MIDTLIDMLAAIGVVLTYIHRQHTVADASVCNLCALHTDEMHGVLAQCYGMPKIMLGKKPNTIDFETQETTE